MNLAHYSNEPHAIGYPSNLRTERNIVQARALEALIYDDDREFNRLDRVVQYLDKEIADAAEGVRSKPKKPKTKYTEVKNKPKKKVVVTPAKTKQKPLIVFDAGKTKTNRFSEMQMQERLYDRLETGREAFDPYFV